MAKQSEDGRGAQFKEERYDAFRPTRGAGAENLLGIGDFAETIELVVAAGAYISFGRTMDGGATVVRVLDGDRKLTSYCHTRGEVLEALAALRLKYKPERKPLSVVGAVRP